MEQQLCPIGHYPEFESILVPPACGAWTGTDSYTETYSVPSPSQLAILDHNLIVARRGALLLSLTVNLPSLPVCLRHQTLVKSTRILPREEQNVSPV
jgi:hypothetical protein